ncbi:MAG TPA: intradiol ring-cleavage dioxygenase [Acidimicrobiales bacterium]
MDDELHTHDRGLSHDLPTLLTRRRALQVLGGAGLGAGLLVVAGCGSSSSDGASATTGATTATTAGSSASTTTTTAGSTGTTSCEALPEETAGPYPGDGSNGPDVLGESGVVRSDITSSFGDLTGTAAGVPLIIKMKVLDAAGCTPKPGAAVYLWHCDREGRYSLYSQGVTDQNYLRGVQEADAEGWVTFTSIFPAAYSGRWPHIHFEVYDSLSDASSVKNKIATSQIALPQDVCEVVYATDGYSASVRNLAQTSLQRDNVFSDGWTTQLATVTGSVSDGYVAQLNCPV